jgi:hypothetical protein
MRHIFAKRLPIAILSFAAITTQAQNSNRENSPYSRFGIGELRNYNNVMLKGMGSISTAYASPVNVNTANPASYASLILTTYEAAGEGNRRTVKATNADYQTGMATLTYMHVGIPMGKYAGMALGLRPVSTVYYRLNDTTNVDSFGSAIKGYRGEGSLNQGYIGFAGKYGGFSLGFNFGYIFGTIEHISTLDPYNDASKVLGAGFLKRSEIGGINWDAGAMYDDKLTDKLSIRGGVTVSSSQSLSANRSEHWIAYRNVQDTIFSQSTSGKIILPTKYSAGVQLYSTNKWVAGIDYSGANWSQYRYVGSTDSLAASTHKISVGAEYTPDINAMRKYFQRVTYRLGAYYGTDPVMLRGTQLDYYALTAGISWPFKKNVARIHTSFEIGSLGTTANGLLRENFVRFGLGLSFNDKWFIKRKYE